ncbi:hypothetical protein F511_34276 [Dorcoceras hygrometricum]|uniref:Uncharacterized protein n=1 Tax=Dorcoceras hygrometricum TaxID=472368 RepID=A0A2Z7ANR8_9LAMI|nr:hypothetical protein F511_34276 [Dorcoceras hygrometricum]
MGYERRRLRYCDWYQLRGFVCLDDQSRNQSLVISVFLVSGEIRQRFEERHCSLRLVVFRILRLVVHCSCDWYFARSCCVWMISREQWSTWVNVIVALRLVFGEMLRLDNDVSGATSFELVATLRFDVATGTSRERSIALFCSCDWMTSCWYKGLSILCDAVLRTSPCAYTHLHPFQAFAAIVALLLLFYATRMRSLPGLVSPYAPSGPVEATTVHRLGNGRLCFDASGIGGRVEASG